MSAPPDGGNIDIASGGGDGALVVIAYNYAH